MQRSLEIAGYFNSAPDTSVRFQGKTYSARSGEPLAISLWAHGVLTLGRSGKYHRPRGMFCALGHCGHCVARIDGLPNRRLCTHRAGESGVAEVQNVVGTARFDVLGSIDWLFSGGLDHHHLMTQSVALNRLAVSVARHLAGLGQLPAGLCQPLTSLREEEVDVLVVGAGNAGRAAAEVLARSGLRLRVLEAQRDANPLGQALLAATTVVGFYDESYVLAVDANSQWRLRTKAVLLATGAYEQLPPCENNDLPGVLGFKAAIKLLEHGVLPGRSVALAICSHMQQSSETHSALQLAARLQECGAKLVLVGDADGASLAPPNLARLPGALSRIIGRARVRGIRTDAGGHADVDALVWCAKATPAFELAKLMGVSTRFDAEITGFVPVCDDHGRTARPGVFVAGELAGVAREDAANHGQRVAKAVLQWLQGDGS